MTRTVDVVVAGAGPAGTAAAVHLRRLGRSVVVVDKATFPRDKCCGDGLTAAALRHLEVLGLDPTSVPSWQAVEAVSVVGAAGRRVDLPLRDRRGGLLAASARRVDLDAAMVGLARAAGVDVLEGHAVEAVEATDVGRRAGGVEVTAGGRAIRGRYLLAADGMWSPVRRMLGLTPPGYLGEWQAGRQYLRAPKDLARRLWVWFEPDMLPGYAWSFPLAGGMVNFGYGVLRPASGAGIEGGDTAAERAGPPPLREPALPAPALRGQRIEWSDRPALSEVLGGAEAVGPWRAWPIPARIGRAPLSGLGDRVLFVGDATGACDPMTGEGIAQAMETAEVAAHSIHRAGPDRPERAARRYRLRIRSGMEVDDRLARALSTVLTRPGGSERALAMVDASDWCRRNFARWMFEDYPRAALATPHRWSTRMFTRPGAFSGT